MLQKSEWWKEFFSGLAVDMWGLAVTAEQTRLEADFIQKQLQLTPPAALLDVPCGSGRLALDLGSAGGEPFAFGSPALYLVAGKAGT